MTVLPHWKVMKEFDSEMYDRGRALLEHVVEKGEIPRKYRELIIIAICCILRYEPGIEYHTQCALDHGATEREIFEATALSLLPGGVPAFRSALKTLEELDRMRRRKKGK